MTSTLRIVEPASVAVVMMAGRSVRAPWAVTSMLPSATLALSTRSSLVSASTAAAREPLAASVTWSSWPTRATSSAACPLGEDVPAVDDADAVAEPLRLLHVVRRVEDGHAPAAKIVHGLQDGVAALRVDTHGRLVKHEQLGLVKQADADVEAPLHAAGVGVGAVVRPFRQAGEVQDGADALLEHPPGEPLQSAEEAQVLACREVRVDGQVLGHVADERLGVGGLDRHRQPGHGDAAAVAFEQAADHRDARGLAGAVGPEEAVGLAAIDVEADAVDCGDVLEALVQVRADEQRCRIVHVPSPGGVRPNGTRAMDTERRSGRPTTTCPASP